MKKKYAQKAGGTGKRVNSRFKKPIETPTELVLTPKTIYTMKEIVAMCLAKRKSA